jgi:hypothetical protein
MARTLSLLIVLLLSGCADSATEPQGSSATGGEAPSSATSPGEVPVAEAPSDDVAVAGCVRAGCSQQLCIPEGEDRMTTCEFRAEYACYREAVCERQPDGECGFSPTPELSACLESPPAP